MNGVVKSNAEKLEAWRVAHPERLAVVTRLVRRMLNAPKAGADATVAVHVNDVLNAIFGVEP